jgi:hypothetical protein
LEDFGGLTEVMADGQAPERAPSSAPPLVIAQQEAPVIAQQEPHSEAADPVKDDGGRAKDNGGHAKDNGGHAKDDAGHAKDDAGHAKDDAGHAKDDAGHAKDFAVPKGTFASEIPQPSPPPTKAADASGELKTAAREALELPLPPASASNSSQRLKEPRGAQRPPFLASEILREDLTPLEPGKRALTHVTQFAGTTGCVGALLLSHQEPFGLLAALVCVGLVVLATIRMEYTTRAAVIALLSGAGLVAAVLARLSFGASHDDPMLAAACALLPAALLFRAWYRAAQTARVLVSASLVFAVAWAAMTSHRGLLTLGFTWQSWLPALAWYLFGILCLLSLLAFMGDETTGGCAVWALGLSVWFALFACLRSAMETETFSDSTRTAAGALGLAEAAFAAPLAVSLAQLYARAMVSRRRAALARG